MCASKSSLKLKQRLPHGAIKEVADELGIAEGTVRYHLNKLSNHECVALLIERAAAEDQRKAALMKQMAGKQKTA